MKFSERVKHFLGWLFRYCPYGGDCPPKHPFKKEIHVFKIEEGGGGC